MLGFYFLVNDNKDVDVNALKSWGIYIFYNSFVLFCNPKTQTKKGLILYNTTNGITSLKKHVKVNYSIIAKMFENEVNNPLRGELEKKIAKKDQI